MFGLAPGRSFSVTTKKRMLHGCIAAVQIFLKSFHRLRSGPSVTHSTVLYNHLFGFLMVQSKNNEFKKTF